METIKIVASDLIIAWNTLDDLIIINEDPVFTAQAKRLMSQIRDEVLFWNNLSKEEKRAIGGEELEVNVMKISRPPKFYSNEQAKIVQPFMENKLPTRQPALKKLVESKKEE